MDIWEESNIFEKKGIVRELKVKCVEILGTIVKKKKEEKTRVGVRENDFGVNSIVTNRFF